MSYVQDFAEGHQCEYKHWTDILIKYFWNTEIKQGTMLTYIYITRVAACIICTINKGKCKVHSCTGTKALYMFIT